MSSEQHNTINKQWLLKRRPQGMVCLDDFEYREDIQQGFDDIPATFLRLFAGKNTGKQLLHLADPE
jgi:NADPH-dependent curcumin reductase CurA